MYDRVVFTAPPLRWRTPYFEKKPKTRKIVFDETPTGFVPDSEKSTFLKK